MELTYVSYGPINAAKERLFCTYVHGDILNMKVILIVLIFNFLISCWPEVVIISIYQILIYVITDVFYSENILIKLKLLKTGV